MRRSRKSGGGDPELFIEPSGQLRLLDKSAEQLARKAKRVECLGLTFDNDEARRAHFLEKLREKLKDPEFRKIEGFPIGEDEDLLRLSDPPYYTACPNPFLADFVKHYGKPYDPNIPYRKEPFAVDVSEGKGGAVYKAHTYHTKVPHEAIARYILHYTEPGDIVLDAFAGSGMTGVAASFCEDPDSEFRISVERAQPNVRWGLRRAILIDLSPFATFLSYGMNQQLPKNVFREEALQLLETVEKKLGKDLYGTPPANYLVWSQALICPECGHSFPFAEVAIADGESINTQFLCPACKAEISKSKCQMKEETHWDSICGTLVKQHEYAPVWVGIKGREGIQPLRETDLQALARVPKLPIADLPVVQMLFKEQIWGDMYRAGYHFGITYVHHFWTPRNLAVLSWLWKFSSEGRHPNQMRLLLTSFMVKTGSRMHNVGMKDGKINLAGQIFNTLQIPSLYAERNIFELAKGKIDDLVPIFSFRKGPDVCLIDTSSATELRIPDNSIDYVFVDPPFGKNIMYSEMSFLYEAWLRVYTSNVQEAIISETQQKDVHQYRSLMTRAFLMLCRVLKPGRWITVAFHNSRNEVWNALQESLNRAGFVIADVRVLDKKQGTFKQMTTVGAVKQDLVISAYKPNSGLEERFKLEAGSEAGAWDFVKTHLRQLPVFVQAKGGQAETVAERMSYLLYDRMVAFHVQRGVTVPLSAAEFYAGLKQRFSERDSMYFLPEQVAEYDKKRMTVKELLQLELAPSDESSAIQWLRQRLTRKPQTFQELHPQFIKAIAGWERHEKALELSDLLKENFLCYDSTGPIPPQIVSWLKQSTELRDLIRTELASDHASEDNGALVTRHSLLITRAKDHWYIPDSSKASDLEKLRERTLLKEFEEYRDAKQKKLRVFRLEAVRAGFKKAWQDRDYRTIIDVAEKIPENVLQEDPKLLMWYDQAMTRSEDA
jgi:DNA modification methylase